MRLGKRRLSGWLVTVVIVAGIVLGGNWLLHRAGRVYQRIWPSLTLGPSTSDEPYELKFRNSFSRAYKNNPDLPPREWILSLPRAYVMDITGSNGNAYLGGGQNMPETYFSAYLETIVTPEGAVVPETKVAREDRRKRSLMFHITNKRAPPQYQAAGCVPQEQVDQILDPSSQSNRIDECGDQDYRCEIHVPMDGWTVEVAATRDLYADTDAVCATARDFLNKYTIKRNKLELE